MSLPPVWVNDYVGLPFRERGRDRAGCDCWGLVRLVLGERFGVAVPSYADGYESIRDHERLAGLVEAGRGEDWLPVCRDEVRAGDVLLLRLSGLPIHVAVLAAPGWMLHTRAATGSVLERFAGLAWGRRVLGIYRYQVSAQGRATPLPALSR